MNQFKVKRSDLKRQRVVDSWNKPTLHLIGYWKEEGKDNYIDPNLLVDPKWKTQDKNKIIQYLKSGSFHEGYFGWSNCRVCGKRNGGTELTDGFWYWPEGLTHYVEDHDVRLPEEFISYMRLGKFKCSKIDFSKIDFEIKEGFWERWCISER